VASLETRPYDLLKNPKRRHGRDWIRDLESKMPELIHEECHKSYLDEEAMKTKIVNYLRIFD